MNFNLVSYLNLIHYFLCLMTKLLNLPFTHVSSHELSKSVNKKMSYVYEFASTKFHAINLSNLIYVNFSLLCSKTIYQFFIVRHALSSTLKMQELVYIKFDLMCNCQAWKFIFSAYT